MMKKLSLSRLLPIMAVVIALFFTACKEDPTVFEFEQTINVTIQGIVYDNDGNTPLDSVKVRLANDSVFTNAEGVYEFRNKTAGSHLLRFTKSGYATMVQTIGTEGTDYTANAIINTSPVFMFANGATLNTALFRSNGVVNIPAANVPFKITFNNDEDLDEYYDALRMVALDDDLSSPTFFENNVIRGTTDANGRVNVNNLPEVRMELEVSYNEGNFRYFLNRSNMPADFNLSYNLNVSAATEFRLTDTNIVEDNGNQVNNLDAGSNITFTFSDNIDAAYEDTFVQLRKFGASNREVLIDANISGATLTIDPEGAALEEGIDYTVLLELASINGVTYSRNFGFTIAGDEITALGQVTNFTIDNFQSEVSNTTSVVRFQFTEVEDASSYQAFARYSEGTDEFIELDKFSEFSGEEPNEREFSVNFATRFSAPSDQTGLFDNGSSIDIKVRAVNGNTFGAFSTAYTVNTGDKGVDVF